MGNIQLQFVSSPNLGSWGIQWFSAGYLSHVDAIAKNGNLIGARSNKVGGKPPGVQIRLPKYTKFNHVLQFSITCTDSQEIKFWDFITKQIGKPYDKKAIWGFLFDRNWREVDSWICSELIAAALEYAGIISKLYLPENKITPVCLSLIVAAIGGIIINF